MATKTSAKYIKLDVNSLQDDGSNNVQIKLATTAGLNITSGLAVGAGTGIAVNASNVAVNTASTVTFAGATWTFPASNLQISTTPSGNNDAVPKSYVDNAINGLAWKQSVRVATTGAGALTTSFANGMSLDTIPLVTGDRILIKNQTTATENGIYTVNAVGAPTRSTDADLGTELVQAAVFAREGSTQADTAWVCTNDGTIAIGTTSIVFAQFSNITPGDITAVTAGAGLTGGGTTGDVTLDVGAGDGITVAANTVSLASTTAGAGLTYTTGVLDVGAGTGITVNANDVQINTTSSVTFTSGTWLWSTSSLLQTSVAPTAGNDVTNKTYVDLLAYEPQTDQFTQATLQLTYQVTGPLTVTPKKKGNEVHFVPLNPSGPLQEYGVDYITIQLTSAGSTTLATGFYAYWGTTSPGDATIVKFTAAGSSGGDSPTIGMSGNIVSGDKFAISYFS